MVLKRWNPYRELKQMEDTMDRLWRIGGFRLTARFGGLEYLNRRHAKNDDIIVSIRPRY